jgi:hypothetical protein
MEKLNIFDTPALVAIWNEWEAGLANKQFETYQGGYDKLQVFPRELLLALADQALERALKEDSLSFLLLSTLTAQEAQIAFGELPALRRTPQPDRKVLLEYLSAWIASMTVIENPAPLDTTDIPKGQSYPVKAKLERLAGIMITPGIVQHAAARGVCSAFLQLDRDAYLRAVNEKNSLATIVFLLEAFETEDLVTLAVEPLVSPEPMRLSVLWKLTRAPFSLADQPTGFAIGALLDKLKIDSPTCYEQIIAYFQSNGLFSSGLAHHISRMTELADVQMALRPIPMARSQLAEAPPHPLFAYYRSLEPGNMLLYLKAIYEKWHAWCREQVLDPQRSVYYLALSGFEESLDVYYAGRHSAELERETVANLEQLSNIDFKFFKSGAMQNKTLVVAFTQLHFLKKALASKSYQTVTIAKIAGELLDNPIWMSRHVYRQVIPDVLREILECFTLSNPIS